jgi:hypothetical protein
VFGLIIDYAKKYYENDYKLPAIPQQFKNDAQETKKQNDKFRVWFEDQCKYKEDGKVSKQQIISVSGLKENEVMDGMARLGFKYNRDLKGFDGNWKRGGWMGCIIDNEVDEVCEVDEE